MSSNNNKQPLEITYSSPVFDKTIGFLLDCAERGENRGNQPSPSIRKVSRILRDLSERSFSPHLVSIGPIHRENKKLKEFKLQKECYLNKLLNRCDGSTQKETLEACLQKVNTSIHRIKKSYAGVKKNYSDDELARMMVMDGCFVLEFCFKHDKKDFVSYLNFRIAMDLILLENQVPFFVLKDLFDCLAPYIFKKKGSVTLSQVLDTHLAPYIKLFREKKSTKKNSILSNLLNKLCSLLPEKNSTTDVDSHLPEKISTIDVDSDSTPAHVLGYLHKLYQPVAAKSSNRIHADKDGTRVGPGGSRDTHGILWCCVNVCKQLCSSFCILFRKCPRSNCVLAPSQHAEASNPVDEELAAKSSNPTEAEEDEERISFHTIVDLDRSGMNFKPHQENEWSMTIKFQPSLFPWSWSKPTLLMPTLVIDDTTELILRNFIAYEQSFPQGRYYFTSYARAMDKLIDSQEDIAKLVESKVLVNNLGSNQKAADMINKICKNMFVADFYYAEEFKQMDTYYNGYWPNNIAWLRRVYFSNPWSAIALFAAIILFSLTVVQTVYTVMGT